MLGILVVLNLSARIGSARVLLSGDGVLPLAERLQEFDLGVLAGRWNTWSILYFSDHVEWTFCVLFIGIVAGILLFLGTWRRTALIIAWIVLTSVRARNPMAGDAGDSFLILLLFWSIFLPQRKILRNANSVQRGQRPWQHFSSASLVILLQIALIYALSSISKTGISWREDLSAVQQSLQIQTLTRPIAELLSQFTNLCKFLTWSVLALEQVGPFLAFLSPIHSRARIIVPLLFIGFHLGIACCFQFGVFPWVGVVAWILFLPSPVFDRLRYPYTILLPIRERDYPSKSSSSFFSPYVRALPLALFACVLLWTFSLLRIGDRKLWLPAPLKTIVYITHINQSWNLFAPDPLLTEGYAVVMNKNGKYLPVLSEFRKVKFPPNGKVDLREVYEDKHIRQYTTNMFLSRKPVLIRSYGEWMERNFREEFSKTDSEIFVNFIFYEGTNKEIPKVLQIFPVARVGDDGLAVYR